jgi:pyruvate ferredoxin oxidoreductase gamma subunit
MFQVRVHGRGGQGVVTTSEILALACFREGMHAQAFPSFGSERTGAPVASFVRVSGTAIRSREPVSTPDVVVVQDATLLGQVDVLEGLGDEGAVLVNTVRGRDEIIEACPGLGLVPPGHLCVLPATDIAQRHVGRNVPGPALLGALATLTGLVGIDSLLAAVRERLGGVVGEANAASAAEAFAAASGPPVVVGCRRASSD